MYLVSSLGNIYLRQISRKLPKIVTEGGGDRMVSPPLWPLLLVSESARLYTGFPFYPRDNSSSTHEEFSATGIRTVGFTACKLDAFSARLRHRRNGIKTFHFIKCVSLEN